MYPGDPTTPGYPSYENSTRTDGVNIPAIPSLPISWNNAKVLLDEIAELEDIGERAKREILEDDDSRNVRDPGIAYFMNMCLFAGSRRPYLCLA